ncbi:MAG: hypothetical protein ABWW69_06265 [Pyrodictiaceae archaeon]
MDVILVSLLLALSLYFLIIALYYMVVGLPAASITAAIIGIILLFASLYVFTVSRMLITRRGAGT